jgi:hypothetical protein
MNLQMISSIAQLVGGAIECAPVVVQVFFDKKKLGFWEKVDLVFKGVSGVATIAAGGQNLLLGGRNLSGNLRIFSMAVQSVSSGAHIVRAGVCSAIKLKEGKAGIGDAVDLIGTIASEGGAIVIKANDLYTIFSNEQCIGIIRRVGDVSGIFVRGFHVVRNVIDYFHTKIVYQIPTVEPEESRFRIDRSQPIKDQLMAFAEKFHMQPSVLDRLMHRRMELRCCRFLCPISRRIIMDPLKHKTSGLLFDKESVENWCTKNPLQDFRTESGVICVMTEDSFEKSPEARELIGKEIQNSINFTILSCWKLLKTDVWTAVQGVFTTGKKQLTEKSYWPIDPKQWMIEYIKGVFTQSEKTQVRYLNKFQSYEEFHVRLLHLQTKTIPGILKQIGPFNFEPLNHVRETLEGASGKIAPLLKRVQFGIKISAPKEGKSLSTVTSSPIIENAGEEPHQLFLKMKVHVWTELKGEFDSLNTLFNSKSYWPIDPKQWLIEFDKGVLKCEEIKQKVKFDGVKNPQGLLEGLYHFHDKTIPWYIETGDFFANKTGHCVVEPFATVHQALRSIPARITPLINEVSCLIAKYRYA